MDNASKRKACEEAMVMCFCVLNSGLCKVIYREKGYVSSKIKSGREK